MGRRKSEPRPPIDPEFAAAMRAIKHGSGYRAGRPLAERRPEDNPTGRLCPSGKTQKDHPATSDVDYSPEEVRFAQALDEFRRRTGHKFPTARETLQVLRGLGYVNFPEPEEPALHPESTADVPRAEVSRHEYGRRGPAELPPLASVVNSHRPFGRRPGHLVGNARDPS